MLEAGLIAFRFVHFIAVLSLFGASLYPLTTFRGRLDGFAGEPLALRLRRGLFVSAALVLVGGLGWFVFTTAAMADDLSQVADPAVLRTMMQQTDFGPLWAARLALAIVIAGLLPRWPRKTALVLVPLLAALLLASLVGTGHARVGEGFAGAVHRISDAAHLLAAGLWLGGLWPLSLAIVAARNGEANGAAVSEILWRFSGVASIAVAILVASGLVNSWFLVGSLALLATTPYGQLLVFKVLLFVLMALIAAANRFRITPKLADQHSAMRALWLARLSRHVAAEQVLGVAVVAVVSALGTLQPAIAP